jgi:hypothetical protein
MCSNKLGQHTAYLGFSLLPYPISFFICHLAQSFFREVTSTCVFVSGIGRFQVLGSTAVH